MPEYRLTLSRFCVKKGHLEISFVVIRDRKLIFCLVVNIISWKTVGR